MKHEDNLYGSMLFFVLRFILRRSNIVLVHSRNLSDQGYLMKKLSVLLLTIFWLSQGSNSFGALIGYYNLNQTWGSITDSSGSGSSPGTGAVAGAGLSYSQTTAPAGTCWSLCSHS